VLNAHLESCVKDAFEKGDADKKIQEIIGMIEKLSK
jgi:DNA-binding FrmR family transcriptional regulator